MFKLFSPRWWFAFVLASITALLAYAYYQQYVMILEPCPLCILQRLAFAWMGVFALLGLLHNPGLKGRWVYGGLLSIGGVVGGMIAGRHIWLQSLPPDKIPDCGPGLGYMLDNFPLAEVWQTVLHGSGSCAEVSWQFVGITMPGWTLIWYVGLTIGTLWMLIRKQGA